MKKLYKILCVVVGLSFLFSSYPVQAANTRSVYPESATDKNVDIPDSATTSITGDMTLQFWYMPETQPTNPLFNNFLYKNSGYAFYYWMNGSTEKLKWYMWGGTPAETTLEVDYVLNNDTWYHIMTVYDQSETKIEFFIDCVSIGSDTNQSDSMDDSGSVTWIGRPHASYNAQGHIDDLRIWSTTKTAADCLSTWKQELVGDEASLNAYYKFNGETPFTDNLLDETANNNDLTNNNSVTFPTVIPNWGGAAVIVPKRVGIILF